MIWTDFGADALQMNTGLFIALKKMIFILLGADDTMNKLKTNLMKVGFLLDKYLKNSVHTYNFAENSQVILYFFRCK